MSNNFITILNPLNQFEIRDLLSVNTPLLGDLNISITNISMYVFISFIIITKLNTMTNKNTGIVYEN